MMDYGKLKNSKKLKMTQRGKNAENGQDKTMTEKPGQDIYMRCNQLSKTNRCGNYSTSKTYEPHCVG